MEKRVRLKRGSNDMGAAKPSVLTKAGMTIILLVASLLSATGCSDAVGQTTPPIECTKANAATLCGTGSYCKFPEGSCGEPGSATADPGRCTTIPEICNKMFAPVCGCDGRSYGNECSAAGHGVSVRNKGECRGGGQPQ